MNYRVQKRLEEIIKVIAMYDLKTSKILVVNWCHNCSNNINGAISRRKTVRRLGQIQSAHMYRITQLEL